MNSAKSIAKILYYICLVLAIFYLTTILYAVLCLLTRFGISAYGEGQYLHINYPFTNNPFLNIDNNLPYIIFSFLLPLILYGVFFWLAANVFKVFFQTKLFTQQNIFNLRRFYMLNLIVPVIAAVLASVFVPVESAIWVLVVVHGILGIFTYFLAAIFKQGLNLQNEQDLII
jgi:hypothetical protein